jgi:hypothetical protein
VLEAAVDLNSDAADREDTRAVGDSTSADLEFSDEEIISRGCFDFCVSDCSSILEGNRWKSIKS